MPIRKDLSPKRGPHALSPVAPRQVIVIDDDEAVLGSLRFALEIEGFDVRLCRSAAELAAPLPVTNACLVIDYNLPGEDGLQLLAGLRLRGVELPAILITSHPSPRLHRQAAAMGVPIAEKPLLLGNGLIEWITRALGPGINSIGRS